MQQLKHIDLDAAARELSEEKEYYRDARLRSYRDYNVSLDRFLKVVQMYPDVFTKQPSEQMTLSDLLDQQNFIGKARTPLGRLAWVRPTNPAFRHHVPTEGLANRDIVDDLLERLKAMHEAYEDEIDRRIATHRDPSILSMVLAAASAAVALSSKSDCGPSSIDSAQ